MEKSRFNREQTILNRNNNIEVLKASQTKILFGDPSDRKPKLAAITTKIHHSMMQLQLANQFEQK